MYRNGFGDISDTYPNPYGPGRTPCDGTPLMIILNGGHPVKYRFTFRTLLIHVWGILAFRHMCQASGGAILGPRLQISLLARSEGTSWHSPHGTVFCRFFADFSPFFRRSSRIWRALFFCCFWGVFLLFSFLRCFYSFCFFSSCTCH